LVVAEQFGTLDALFPGRIDLGLGRAPGTDRATMRALRRSLRGDVDDFPSDVRELIDYFRPLEPGQSVRAIPGAGANVSIWILGSSLYGAELAAAFGLPYAFASHFAPGLVMQAIEGYRRSFQPSAVLDRPRVMLGVNAVAADTDDEARLLLTSLQQAFVNLRGGTPTALPPPLEGFAEHLQPHHAAMLEEVLACAAIGAPATVAERLRALLDRTHADELIVTAQIYDHAARLRSFELVAEVRDRLGPTPG
jgi:luciferase family oxidoreductase group 1